MNEQDLKYVTCTILTMAVLCTIETPEGPNIGLISTLCVHAKINEMGFIETPYHKVNEGKVDMKKLTFLSAEEEDTAKIAQANMPLDDKGNFVEDKIASRVKQVISRSLIKMKWNIWMLLQTRLLV